MKLKIKSWESRGLRCPDAGIEIEDARPVVLIQMPSGTGKTTTLTMIRAALTGEAARWSVEKVKEFRGRAGIMDEGRFLLNLAVDDVDLTFEMVFDFTDGRVQYRTTSPMIGGVVMDWKPPEDVRRFLNDKFVDLFVFDGEFADRLLKPEDAEAERAIDALCQLYLLDECADKAKTSWERATRGGGARTDTGLGQWRSKLNNLEEALRLRQTAYETARKRFESYDSESRALYDEIQKSLAAEKNDRDVLEELRLGEQAADADVDRRAESLMSVLRQPHRVAMSFRSELSTLRQQLNVARLPATSSRQFFVDLAREEACICGRSIDETARSAILKQADRYLGEEISGVLNALKGDIELQIDEDQAAEEPTAELDGSAAELNRAIKARHHASTKREAFEREIRNRGDHELQRKQERYENLKGEAEELRDVIAEMDAPARSGDDAETSSIASLKQQVSEARRKVEEITETVELGEQTRTIEKVCARAKDKARHVIRMKLVDECNKWLEKVLPYAPVRVKRIDRSLHLEGQSGASVGQTLAVGYTFLTSLLHRGQHQFPLIIDSPANPIDITTRRQIGGMVPTLCEQFIAFTISSEREGFIDALEEAAQGKVSYYTLFRVTPGTQPLMGSLPETGVRQSEGAVLVEGKDYFYSFDLDREGE